MPATCKRLLPTTRFPIRAGFMTPPVANLFSSPGRIEVTLLPRVAAGRRQGQDNELFVLLVDLLELSEDLAPLLRAVKITLYPGTSRLVLICPWPPGVPPPPHQRPALRQSMASAVDTNLQAALQASRSPGGCTGLSAHAGQAVMRPAWVPVVCAEGGDPVRLLLDRLDRLRSVGLGRKR